MGAILEKSAGREAQGPFAWDRPRRDQLGLKSRLGRCDPARQAICQKKIAAESVKIHSSNAANGLFTVARKAGVFNSSTVHLAERDEYTASMLDYPLRFQPVFRRYLWGGRRLGTHLNKNIGEGNDYAESWEIVDHGTDQSVVIAGNHKGRTLRELVADHNQDLFGRHAPQAQFPLLFKFLDCCRDLSLQVHPDDQHAQRQTPPDLGKTEAWIILEAQPGSVAYAGLKLGFDRPAVEREVARGTLALCMNRVEAQPGDCLFLPAGVIHGLGKGLLAAEIQQASDTTFRLFDWNRVGPDGRPRPLHIEQGLAVADFNAGPITPQVPRPTDRPHVERLVGCDKFVLDRWRFDAPQSLSDDNRFHIVAVLEGAVQLEGDPLGQSLVKGQTALIPAACRQRLLTPTAASVLLDIYLPQMPA
jgi:mannose-6-phosphate isomerase